MSSFRRALAEVRSRVRALRERFDARLSANEGEAHRLKPLMEWPSPDQLAQFNVDAYDNRRGNYEQAAERGLRQAAAAA